MSKRRVVVQNQRKEQKAFLSKVKKEEDTKIYKDKGYRVITVAHLADKMDIIEDLKKINTCNTVIKEFVTKECNLTELSYTARTSDMLILTTAGSEMDTEHFSVLKKHLPSTIVVYDQNKEKVYAKTVSKIFGNVKIAKKLMLKDIIKTFAFENNRICKNRPFMVVKEIETVGDKMILGGFMKKGLVSNKLIINGEIEALIEQVVVGDECIQGEELNRSEDVAEYLEENATEEEGEESENEKENEIDENEENECDTYEGIEEEELNPEYDLIEKYSEYHGIKSLQKVKFKYEKQIYNGVEVKQFKKIQHLENKIVKLDKKVKDNSYVKIMINKKIDSANIIAFNLFEYETQLTQMNYSFECAEGLESTFESNTEITVDNGIRMFKTKCAVSHNYAQNAFQIQRKLQNGIVSFVAPVTFFTKHCMMYTETQRIVGTDGESSQRVFLHNIKLKGTPVKIFKHHVVLRGMFFTQDQVKYFEKVALEAKNGNRGVIKKSLGTKGLFKAEFESPIKHGDQVVMNLYKRVYLS